MRPAERVSFAVVARGLAGRLSLESVRRSGAFEELLDVSNPVPVSFDLSEFVGPVSSGLPSSGGVAVPQPRGGLGGLQVDGPSVVEQGVASARASRLGRSAPSLDDWVVAGSGRR